MRFLNARDWESLDVQLVAIFIIRSRQMAKPHAVADEQNDVFRLFQIRKLIDGWAGRRGGFVARRGRFLAGKKEANDKKEANSLHKIWILDKETTVFGNPYFSRFGTGSGPNGPHGWHFPMRFRPSQTPRNTPHSSIAPTI